MKIFGIDLNKMILTPGQALDPTSAASGEFNPKEINFSRGNRKPIFQVIDTFENFEDWHRPFIDCELNINSPDPKKQPGNIVYQSLQSC